MRILKLAIPFSILLGGVMICTSVSFGKLEYTQKEKKGCTVCHVAAKSKDLNAVGQCYKQKKTLTGCETPKK